MKVKDLIELLEKCDDRLSVMVRVKYANDDKYCEATVAKKQYLDGDRSNGYSPSKLTEIDNSKDIVEYLIIE